MGREEGGGNMREEIIGKSKKVLFRVKWLAMSDGKRYVYLWSRTEAMVYGNPQGR
jgi:hypothetical protein